MGQRTGIDYAAVSFHPASITGFNCRGIDTLNLYIPRSPNSSR